MRIAPKALTLFVLALGLVRPAAAVDVDLAEFPDAGGPVPDGTVLAEQWRPIGILFSARTEGGSAVDPIQQYFGFDFGHLFFSPDVFGAIAEFTFVESGTDSPTDVTAFELTAFFDGGETAQLVAFDDLGAQVDEFSVDGSAAGDVVMSVVGSIRTAEWRTQGNPGIAAKFLAFTPVPEPHPTLLLACGALVLVLVRSVKGFTARAVPRAAFSRGGD